MDDAGWLTCWVLESRDDHSTLETTLWGKECVNMWLDQVRSVFWELLQRQGLAGKAQSPLWDAVSSMYPGMDLIGTARE